MTTDNGNDHKNLENESENKATANVQNKTKFYKRGWFMWLMLVVFAPVGIFLLWKFHPEKSKTFKIVITVIFVFWFILLLANTGNTGQTSKTTNDNQTASQNSTESTQDTDTSNSAKLKEGDLTGKSLTEALKVLKSHDEKYKIVNKSNGYDFTGEVDGWSTEYTDGWVVSEARSSWGTWQIKITTPEAQATESRTEALQAKLDVSAAITAVEQYGRKQYPYGFKVTKIVTGVNSDVAVDDNTWALKYDCEVTNQYGGGREAIVEAKVTGTTDAPKVTDFLVY